MDLTDDTNIEIETHLDDTSFDVEKLCHAMGLSHSQVHGKLSALTGLSATWFICYIRLVKAQELLLRTEFILIWWLMIMALMIPLVSVGCSNRS